jgi:hypothetical protein
MVSPYLVGALEGLEAGFAQRELKAKEARAEDRAERALQIKETEAERKKKEAIATKKRTDNLAGLFKERQLLFEQIKQIQANARNQMDQFVQPLRKEIVKDAQQTYQGVQQYWDYGGKAITDDKGMAKATKQITEEAKRGIANANRQAEIQIGIPARKRIENIQSKINDIPNRALKFLDPKDISSNYSKALLNPTVKKSTNRDIRAIEAEKMDWFHSTDPNSAKYKLNQRFKESYIADDLVVENYAKKPGWSRIYDKAGRFPPMFLNGKTNNLYLNGKIIQRNFRGFGDGDDKREINPEDIAYNSSNIYSGGDFYKFLPQRRKRELKERDEIRSAQGIKPDSRGYPTISDLLKKSSKTYWSQSAGLPSNLADLGRRFLGTFVGGDWTNEDQAYLKARMMRVRQQYILLMQADTGRGTRLAKEWSQYVEQFGGGGGMDAILGDDQRKRSFFRAIQEAAEEIHNRNAGLLTNIAYADKRAVQVVERAKGFLSSLGDVTRSLEEEKYAAEEKARLQTANGNACGIDPETRAGFSTDSIIEAGDQMAICTYDGFKPIMGENAKKIIKDKFKIEALASKLRESKRKLPKIKTDYKSKPGMREPVGVPFDFEKMTEKEKRNWLERYKQYMDQLIKTGKGDPRILSDPKYIPPSPVFETEKQRRERLKKRTLGMQTPGLTPKIRFGSRWWDKNKRTKKN